MESVYTRKVHQLWLLKKHYIDLSYYFEVKELKFLKDKIYQIDAQLKEINKSVGTISDGGKGNYKWKHGTIISRFLSIFR